VRFTWKDEKLDKFDFIPASEHVFMIASKKWNVSSPMPFSTSGKCNKVYASVNLKLLTIITLPEGCMMIQ
jgi:hypothetical protein